MICLHEILFSSLQHLLVTKFIERDNILKGSEVLIKQILFVKKEIANNTIMFQNKRYQIQISMAFKVYPCLKRYIFF